MSHSTTRRGALRGAAAFSGLGVLLAATAARAAGGTPKTEVQYQYKPQGKNQCGLCASFIPGADAAGPGTCRIVEGAIPQTGWCILFSPKSR